MTKNWGIKHFKVIENALLLGEDVFMSFIGLHNYISATHHEDTFAYAITNKRFILGQKKVVVETLKNIYLDDINDIAFKSGLAFGIMAVDTIKEVFNVGLDKASAKAITLRILEIINSLKQQNPTQQKTFNISSVSSADEILKFKQLLDMGVLTQEEYEIKKKQLLENL